MKLGILYKDGKIVNHRSLLKVLLNPILRYFGYCIGSKINHGMVTNIVLFKCEKSDRIFWNFNSHNPYDIIVKKRKYY